MWHVMMLMLGMLLLGAQAQAAESAEYAVWDTPDGDSIYVYTGDISVGKPVGQTPDGKTMKLAQDGKWPCRPMVTETPRVQPRLVLAGGWYLFAVPAEGKACS